jgi:DNA end-binding protein Ku
LPEFEEDDSSSSRPFWSGTISFGLVSVPVNLFPANRSGGVRLRMIGPRGKPLSRRYYSEKTGRDLGDEDIVRGYEIEKEKYVVVTDDELERLAPEKSRDIDLRRFVRSEQIPKLLFERGYFLAPAGASAKAYKLLAETMECTGRTGIATFVMRGKEYLVAILAENGILRAETLRFHDEIRTPADVGLPDVPKKADARTVSRFEKIIEQKTSKQLPRAEMVDEDSERLRMLIEKKRAKGEDVVGAGRKGKGKAQVVDLLEVLQKALAAPGGGGTAKRKRSRSAA